MNTNLLAEVHEDVVPIDPVIEFGSLPVQKPLMFIEIDSPLDAIGNNIAKRIFDIIISGLLIITVLSWLTPLLAACILADSRGPVFFRQKRTKRGGRKFSCLKFRTMVCNDMADLQAASENDPRITRLGLFLRNHHLDELPQLINVFTGDMSLIGPRPHMISDNQKYETMLDNYGCRHKIKPGITGLAQVKGYVGTAADSEHMKRRLEKDIDYIRNWSFGLDIKIIWQTFSGMVRTLKF